VAGFLRRWLESVEEPVGLGAVAHHVRATFGVTVAKDWLGYGTFKLLLQELLPEAVIDTEGAGHVHPLRGGPSRP
jgi:uncharacterized membrane protein